MEKLKVIARMLDEDGTLHRVYEGCVMGGKSRARKVVEKILRDELADGKWKWNTLIIEAFDEVDRQEYRKAQRTLGRIILNQNHSSFPCGRRTAYYSHSGGDGSAWDRGSSSGRSYVKDLNRLYDIFEKILGFRPSVDGDSLVIIDSERLALLKKRTGHDGWFLQTWLNSPKDKHGVIKRSVF
jgi:hypothetical protein